MSRDSNYTEIWMADSLGENSKGTHFFKGQDIMECLVEVELNVCKCCTLLPVPCRLQETNIDVQMNKELTAGFTVGMEVGIAGVRKCDVGAKLMKEK